MKGEAIWVNLKSHAGKVPKLDEDLKKRIKQLSNPTLDDIANTIEEFRANKIQRAQITLEEDEIYRFTI